mgnify:CR=1 FL=1
MSRVTNLSADFYDFEIGYMIFNFFEKIFKSRDLDNGMQTFCIVTEMSP